ncbi:MAG: NAD(+) synthase [Muribaculaceae bacterium]|nr:NAD(+) synthase [Muribaculaceae bacterium]
MNQSNNFGFFRVRAYVPEVRVADTLFNASQIIQAVKEAENDRVDCMVFPELSVTGYTCADLFQQELLMQQAEEAVIDILNKTKECDLIFAVGAPVRVGDKRYNCAVVICKGNILGIIPKTHLPNYNEFYEKRWFESGRGLECSNFSFGGCSTSFGTNLIFNYKDVKIGVELCEDLWVPNPPSSNLAMAGAEVLLNLSASDDLIGKRDYLCNLISQQSARCRCAYVYASAGWGESSTDLVFSGKALIGEDGRLFGDEDFFSIKPISHTRDIDIEKLRLDRIRFNTFTENLVTEKEYQFVNQSLTLDRRPEPFHLNFHVEPYPFVPHEPKKLDIRCQEIINIQAYGLMKRLASIGCRKVVIGISGGLDSTLALLVAVKAFNSLNIPLKNIIGVTMPGFATTSRTKSNAVRLMEKLGVTILEIPIGEAVSLHFKDIGQNPDKYDATYENSQARERTQILMDLANKENAIVVGTGDMSELALGWCTYNGDQMSMYGVNASVPKTLVKHLVKWFTTIYDPEISAILNDICDTPISPELVPSLDDNITQKTEDLVGPYELHDFFLFHFLRNSFSPKKILFLACNAFKETYSAETIKTWLKVFIKRFFSQQFKRSCMPDGPKVGSVNLSPRGDWRMPSDASPEIWLRQLDDSLN